MMMIVKALTGRARYVWSKSELSRQSCSDRLDRGRKWTNDEHQTRPPYIDMRFNESKL